MCQLQSFKQNNQKRLIPFAILWRNFKRSRRAQDVVKQLFVPLLSVLWDNYIRKYICYRWKKNASVVLIVKLRLSLKPSSLLLMHQSWFKTNRYIFQAEHAKS